MMRSNVPRSSAIAVLLMFWSACALVESDEPEPSADGESLGRVGQALALDPSFADSSSTGAARPASDYTLFEADPVRPVAVLGRSGLIAVTNTVDDYLELFQPEPGGVQPCGAVKVGMRPVAVAVVSESASAAELWVVNHLSDSISVVEVDTARCRGEVVETLQVGDEPRDVVVTRTRSGAPRVFVTTAHRGQHHPLASARDGSDLVLPPADKTVAGLADVTVFDPRGDRVTLGVVNLFTDTPRALAVGQGAVYAAGFHTGNRTSVVPAERAADRGLATLRPLLATDAEGAFIERDGELVLRPDVRRSARIEGGMPAVVGRGRCLPDPRPDRQDRFVQQLCVQTDAEQRVLRTVLQEPGRVDERCQCTSGDGALQPTASVIVQFFESRRACGAAHTQFPDGSRGCWLDADPSEPATPARHGRVRAPAMAWNEQLRFSLPDADVFEIDVENLEVRRSFSGVGTVLFNMAVQPGSGRLFVTNTEARNLTRFEGGGSSSSSTLRGHLHESRITRIDTSRGRVTPLHLNTHIDYTECCERLAGEAERSLAFPTGAVFSPDGAELYFTALGSDKLVRVEAEALREGFDNTRARRSGALSELTIGASLDEPSGPVGLALDAAGERLYVKTHFRNELVVVDVRGNRVLDRELLHSPEPESIKRGRHVLYDARLTSAHGDSACASCHVFGNFDSLVWDLGDPDAVTVTNPGPYAVTPDLVASAGIAADPLGIGPANRPQVADFRSNKGPMATQTLRGLANQGASHWRGDRTRRFQGAPGQQPNFGTFDEDNSFGEFDVAIVGLNGNDRLLDPEVFQDFTNFALQLTLPPNPIRALDDRLTSDQAAARAVYFGCASMTDEQFARRECVAQDGALVDVDEETQRCSCQKNSFVQALAVLPDVQRFGQALQATLSEATSQERFAALAGDVSELPESEQAQHAALAAAASLALVDFTVASLQLDDRALLSSDAARTLAAVTGPISQLLSAEDQTEARLALLEFFAALAPSAPPGGGGSAPDLAATFRAAFEVSNIVQRVQQDEDARGTGAFRDLLRGCDPSVGHECRLRVTDSFETCQGCHTLDPDGNAELEVFRPGFFGTDGKYSFENESQVLKIPQLRNMYQKVGMFGIPLGEFFQFESVLGARRGGFFVAQPDGTQYMGPQVRGFGFQHDGTSDTLHRFHGTVLFAARAPGTLIPADPGNAQGFDVVLPKPESREACVRAFRQTPAVALAQFPAELAPALGLCLESGPIPEPCFVDPAAPTCAEAVSAVGAQLGDAEFAVTFAAQIRPLCFQLGSMLEGGSERGTCAPEGLEFRAQMESFMLAFDTNLKPMVGQQRTVRDVSAEQRGLRALFSAAAQGHCDLSARQRAHGFLVTHPDAQRPSRSRLEDARGRRLRLHELRRSSGAITFTCHPPQPDQAEARRSAFDSGR